MKKLYKGVIGFAFTLIILAIAITLLNAPQRSITGFAIYTNSCEGAINAEGIWELNSTLNCNTGNGIEINSSNIILDCNDNAIIGNNEDGSIGIQVSSDLTNITIQNCDINDFSDPIVVNSGSNLNIKNSIAEMGDSCVSGNWTNLGGNTGCLDTTGPVISLSAQSIYKNQSLQYQITASDPSGILGYSVNDSENFMINSSGLLKNATDLSIATYLINISSTDTNNYSSSGILEIEVLAIPAPTPDDESDDDSGSSNSGSSSSSDSQSAKTTLKNCTEEEAWTCTDWSACTINEQTGFYEETRSCSKKDSKCSTLLPQTARTCETIQETTLEEITPENEETPPNEEIISEQEGNVALTGGVITALEKLKTIKNPTAFVKNNLIASVSILIIITGFILSVILTRKAKRKDAKRPLTTIKKAKSGKDDSGKLWDWEEKHFENE